MPNLTTVLAQPERARTDGRAGWVSLLGLVLVPLVVGGLLTWALWQPTEHLDRMQAAVVNVDIPVQLNGQTVPLGRELTAALVTSTGAGVSEGEAGAVPSVADSSSTENFTWVVTDTDDAADGLADGRYATVVTIPSTFSAAATSTAGGDASAAVQATIDIATSDRSRLVDTAVSNAVTSTAVSLLNSQLTHSSLTNVFLSFSTLHDNLGQASDGAQQLADGAGQLSTGTTQLADGAVSLADGTSRLAAGSESLAQGVGQLDDGADELSAGLDQLATQTAASARTAAAAVPQAQQFGAGMDALDAGITGPGGLADGVSGLATGTGGMQQLVAGVLTELHTEAQRCVVDGDRLACATVAAIIDVQRRPDGVDGRPTLTGASAELAAGASALNTSVNDGTATTPPLTSSVDQLTAAAHQLVGGVTSSAAGLGVLSGYLQQSAAGADQLAAGTQDAAAGADELASGAASAATGAADLSTGAGQVDTGAAGLASGSTQLASGLEQTVAQVPDYTDVEAATLAGVVGTPVVADDGEPTSLFGAMTVPFLATVALWIGALATFVVIGAVSRTTFGSTQPSAVIALQSFAPGALVGVLQGLAITAVMAGALDLTPGGWAAFATVAMLAGVAFAAVNQGLVAVLGGVGRFVSVIVAVIGLATAVISTVPAVLDRLFAVLPLAAALDGLQGVVLGDGGVGGAIALLLVWTLAGLALTMSAVARRRVVPAGQLARWTRAA